MIPLAQIYAGLSKFQYLILFPVTAIEGPIISVIAGFLIAQGMMNFYLAYFVIITGDLAGDSLYYAMGKWGKKLGMRLLKLTPEKLKKLEHHFEHHSGKTILLGKLAHGIGTAFLFAAGAAEMPFGKFLYYNVLGTMPKSLILITVGYFFGHSYASIGKYFDYFGAFTFILGACLLAAYLIFFQKNAQKRG